MHPEHRVARQKYANNMLSGARDTARIPTPSKANHSRFLASARTTVRQRSSRERTELASSRVEFLVKWTNPLKHIHKRIYAREQVTELLGRSTGQSIEAHGLPLAVMHDRDLVYGRINKIRPI